MHKLFKTSFFSLLVIGDASGAILFFDKTIRILYWLREFSVAPIVSISFNKIPKFKEEGELAIYTGIPNCYSLQLYKCIMTIYSKTK